MHWDGGHVPRVHDGFRMRSMAVRCAVVDTASTGDGGPPIGRGQQDGLTPEISAWLHWDNVAGLWALKPRYLPFGGQSSIDWAW